MKFLCVSCDTQMKLIKTASAVEADQQGSLSIRYECPACLMEIAMLTNAYETQVVTSLGVEIGGQTVSMSASGSAAESEAAAAKCPFSKNARNAIIEERELTEITPEEELAWTAQALVRLQNIPEFVRPMAKLGIEKFAKDQGFAQIDDKCLDQAKEVFGM